MDENLIRKIEKYIPGDVCFLERDIHELLKNTDIQDIVMTSIGDDKSLYTFTLITKSVSLDLFNSGINLVFPKPTDPTQETVTLKGDFEWRWGIKKYLNSEDFDYSVDSFIELGICVTQDKIASFNQIVGIIIDKILIDGVDAYQKILEESERIVEKYKTGVAQIEAEIDNITNKLDLIKNEIKNIQDNFHLTLKYIYENYKSEYDIINTAVESIQNSIQILRDTYNIEVNLYSDTVKSVIKVFGGINLKFDELIVLLKKLEPSITAEELQSLLIPQFKVGFFNPTIALEFPRKIFKPMILQQNKWIVDENEQHLFAIDFKVDKIAYDTQQGYEVTNAEILLPPGIGVISFTIPLIKIRIELEKNIKLWLSRTIDNAVSGASKLVNSAVGFVSAYIGKAKFYLPEEWFEPAELDSPAELFAQDLQIGSGGLTGKIGLRTKPGRSGELSYKLGTGNDKWTIGFTEFDLRLWQNKIQSSDIKGLLEVPNFKQKGATAPLKIDVSVFFENDDNFRISASPQGGLTFVFGEQDEVFSIHVKSLESGSENDKLYLEVSGDLDFSDNKILKELIQKPIEIKKLRIYSNGSFEIEGGSIPIPTSVHLNLGPVEVNITNITLGAETLANNGSIEKNYKYIGFDCGVSTGAGGLDLRGDGIKLYFDEKGNDMFLRIAGIGIDLTIPGTASKEDAALILKGYLSIREDEYTGAVSFKLPKVKIAGGAAMKLRPRVPAFIVDASLEMSTPFPLGATGLGIYGFRGLFGLRYIAKLDGALTDPAEMFKFYSREDKNPATGNREKGIHIGKFYYPDENIGQNTKAKDSGTPISIGAGLSLATVADAGNLFSMQAFLLLSLPELFMISGRANILSERVGLIDSEPPFFAYLAITPEYISSGMGAEYKIPKGKSTNKDDGGDFLELHAEGQMAYFFKDSSRWFVHFGTKDNPNKARILKKIFDINAGGYFMLSAAGIEAGANVRYQISRQYGPIDVELKSYGEANAMMGFSRPQVGGGISIGGSIKARVFGVGFSFGFGTFLTMTLPKPFKIDGGVWIYLEIDYWFDTWSIRLLVELKWAINPDKDIEPIGILDISSNTAKNPVSAYHIGSERTYLLSDGRIDYPPKSEFGSIKIIPLDSFIDIQLNKSVNQSLSVRSKIGGTIQPRDNHNIEIVPPSGDGQVVHKFRIEEVSIKVWAENESTWKDYSPYDALSDGSFSKDFISNGSTGTFIGFWQVKSQEYNNLRILANNPLPFIDIIPGKYIPEESGITATSLFCPAEKRPNRCVVWDKHALYKADKWHSYEDLLFDVTRIDAEVVDFKNGYDIPFSLQFNNKSVLEIILPEKCVQLSLKLFSFAQNLTISFYDIHTTNDTNSPEYILIQEINVTVPDFLSPVIYNGIEIVDGKKIEHPIKKVVIEAIGKDNIEEIQNILIEIIELENLKQQSDNPGQIKERVSYLEGKLEEFRLMFCNRDSDEIESGVIEMLKTTLNDEIINLGKEDQAKNLEDWEKIEKERGLKIDELISLENGHKIWQEKDNIPDKCSTYIQEICYLTQSDYWYNESLPTEAEVEKDFEIMSKTISQIIAPIWRPDEIYVIQVLTNELIDDKSTPGTYYFPFRTAGPIGHFPLENLPDEVKKQFDLDADGNQAVSEKFSSKTELAENSLKYYIDFDRSYPNPIGNIINQKPLYYEDVNLSLFYTETFVYHFFSTWKDYQGLGEKTASMKIQIQDVATSGVLPDTIEWIDDKNPTIPKSVGVINDLRDPKRHNSEAKETCWKFPDDPIIPASKNTEVSIKILEPLKLYNAVIFCEYRGVEKQIHSYPFQTSRYRNMADQLKDFHNQKISYDLFNLDISLQQLLDIVSETDVKKGTRLNLIQNYPDKLQRILSGYLKQKPLHPPNNTEIYSLYNEDQEFFGIWGRSPEPFNDPRIPDKDLNIKCKSYGRLISADIVFAKDRSEFIILFTSANTPQGVLELTFDYLVWNGTEYINKVEVNPADNIYRTITVKI